MMQNSKVQDQKLCIVTCYRKILRKSSLHPCILFDLDGAIYCITAYILIDCTLEFFPFVFLVTDVLGLFRPSARCILTDGVLVECLTDADSCDDRGGDDGQGHSPGDGQVPPVAGCLLQLIVGVDLQQRRGTDTEVHTHTCYTL